VTQSPGVQQEQVVVARRRLRASRKFLFQAWTDPVRFARWFGPKTWMVERCELDPRKGGSWRAWLKTGNGASVYVGGVYLEFEPDRRVVFTWDTNPDRGRPASLSIVTVELVDQADGVEICVTHRELTTGQAVDMDAGWNSSLDSLEKFVMAESANRGFSPSQEED
jgi:uncharacterized protein YndB with AHSA1/START domain